eukprot:g17948.t1
MAIHKEVSAMYNAIKKTRKRAVDGFHRGCEHKNWQRTHQVFDGVEAAVCLDCETTLAIQGDLLEMVETMEGS